MATPLAPVAAASLVGGWRIARRGGRTRGAIASGMLLLTAALLHRTGCARAGRTAGNALLGTYLGAFVLSHPLAKRVGPWPSVLLTSAAAGGATWAVVDRGA